MLINYNYFLYLLYNLIINKIRKEKMYKVTINSIFILILLIYIYRVKINKYI